MIGKACDTSVREFYEPGTPNGAQRGTLAEDPVIQLT